MHSLQIHTMGSFWPRCTALWLCDPVAVTGAQRSPICSSLSCLILIQVQCHCQIWWRQFLLFPSMIQPKWMLLLTMCSIITMTDGLGMSRIPNIFSVMDWILDNDEKVIQLKERCLGPLKNVCRHLKPVQYLNQCEKCNIWKVTKQIHVIIFPSKIHI